MMFFPKEHGAWAVLGIPLLVGTAMGGGFSPDFAFLALSSFSFFIASAAFPMLRGVRDPHRVAVARLWGSAFVLAGFLVSLPLLIKGFWWLIGFGLVAGGMDLVHLRMTRRAPKTVGSDLVAVAGLTLGAPAAFGVSTGEVNATAGFLWLMCFLFFGSSVFYVHMKMRVAGIKSDGVPLRRRMAIGVLNLAYHVLVIGIVIALSVFRLTPEFAALAFLPMTVHAVIGTIRLSARVQFKKLGFLLLAQSILFLFLLIAVKEIV